MARSRWHPGAFAISPKFLLWAMLLSALLLILALPIRADGLR